MFHMFDMWTSFANSVNEKKSEISGKYELVCVYVQFVAFLKFGISGKI